MAEESELIMAARMPAMVAANQGFWSGDRFIYPGQIFAADHPEVTGPGRAEFFSEVTAEEAPAPAPAAPAAKPGK